MFIEGMQISHRSMRSGPLALLAPQATSDDGAGSTTTRLSSLVVKPPEGAPASTHTGVPSPGRSCVLPAVVSIAAWGCFGRLQHEHQPQGHLPARL